MRNKKATWRPTRGVLSTMAFLALAGLGAILSCGSPAQTQSGRVLRVIAPFAAGGPPDTAVRTIVQDMQGRLGRTIIIENRPGAGTTIGTMAVATAAPDGYTLLFNGSNLFHFPALYPKLDFDAQSSLTPVATAVAWSHVLVVGADVPAHTIAELVAYSKANPGKLNFGFGQGTTPQILGASLKQATGADFTFIPYRGGDQARTDLLGGRIQINFAPTATLLALIREGKLRPLAFTGATRSPDLPDVPTMAESGIPLVGYNPDTWLGFLAPPATPRPVVEMLNAEINESLGSATTKAAMARLAFEPMIKTPQEFAAFLSAEKHKWPPLLSAAGFKAE